MSMMAGADLTATVDANVQPYERGIARAIAATHKYETSLASLDADIRKLEKSLDDEANRALARHHDALNKTGKALFLFGAAAAFAFGLAVKEALDWETAWTGVLKTVDGSSSELNQLEDDLRSLTSVLPASHEEIAAVAEAAGQLGIKREDIADFTKVMIDLGETTDLSADQAATSIAQLMNVMQTAPDLVDRIGNTLVDLGNNGASTESQILALTQRLAGAGALVGASEADVLGMASALANLGIEAQLGGGAVQRTMLIIEQAVKSGGKALDGFAELSGMSSQDFAQAWQTDPMRALDAFVQGMGRVQASGGDLIGTLDDVGISGTQNLNVLLRLAGSGDMLTESLDLSAQAWEKNNALLIEAEKRYGTTEAQVAMARNEMVDAAIDIGSLVLPALAAIVGVGADIGRAWQDLPEPLRDLFVILGLVTTAAAIFGGGLMMTIPKIAAFKAAVAGLEAGALRTAGTRLLTFGSILTGPWGLALAGGITALGIFAAQHGQAAEKVEALKATLDAQTGAITDNSREWAVKELFDSGALEKAKQLGINLGELTNAALGNQEALAGVNAEIEALVEKSRIRDTEGNIIGIDQDLNKDATDLRDILVDTNGVLSKARGQWELESEAKRESGAATTAAGGAQQGTTEAWQAGADAAGQLTEEVKTLGEEIGELSGDYLDNRDAGRAVRDQLREIRAATKAYIKEHGDLKGAFKRGTDSGDEFASMLDGLAQDYIRQIETTERVTGSQRKTMQAYRAARDSLFDVAVQLGMTETQAKDYIETILGTPNEARTHFLTPGLYAANQAIANYVGSLNNIPSEIKTTIFQEMQRVPAAPSKPKADGGFAFGTGHAVPRVPQIAAGGANIVWAEPATGWEAYISGKPGMEARNRDVWAEAGRRLGMGGQAGGSGPGTVVVVEKLPSGPVRLTLPNGRALDAYFENVAGGVAREVARVEIDADRHFQHTRAGG